MRRFLLPLLLIAPFALTLSAQERPIIAQPPADAAQARFEQVLRQALGAIARAGSSLLDALFA